MSDAWGVSWGALSAWGISWGSNAIPPVVTAVNPTSGTIAGGNVVTISGTGLSGAIIVNFGSVAAASFVVISDIEIQAVPQAVSGPQTVDITVTTPSGTSAITPADQYSFFVPAPPSTGPSGGAGGQWPIKKRKKVTPTMMWAKFVQLQKGNTVENDVRHDWRYFLRQVDTFALVHELPLEIATELALEQTCRMRNYMNSMLTVDQPEVY